MPYRAGLKYLSLILLFALTFVTAIRCNAQQGGTTFRGTVTDPDDAVIPGALVTLSPASGKALATQSQSDGAYSFRGVPAGTYAMTVTMPQFSSFVRQGIRVGAQPVTLDVKLAIQDEKQEVMVTASTNGVSIDQDSNASSTVIKGKDLDALSDDPDELSSELSALAGPSAGPNGGQIYIDGFTGGQLPPKSSIREIRVNQNPFSAQYDRPGFGRVEVFTKPGTDKFHGSGQLNGSDRSFNTGSPLSQGVPQPDYHTIFFFGNLTGPINHLASFTVGGSRRQIQDNTIINPPGIFAVSQPSGVACLPAQAGCSLFQQITGNPYITAVTIPQTRWDISPRLDLAIGEKNTLTARYQYESNSQQNQGIGNLDLPSIGYSSQSSESEIQISDSQIVSPRVINETRFEYQRQKSSQTPLLAGPANPTIIVQGAFIGGGASSGLASDRQSHVEVQNYTSIAMERNFIRMGGRLRTTLDTNTTTAGSNGTFTYNTLAGYAAGGAPSQFQITRINVPTIQARSTDLGLYAEDDWKVRPNLTFSYGIRFETQNFIGDKADVAPRISFAYGVGGKGNPKTVIRGGFGLFYDRFTLGNEESVYRNNGTNQQQTIFKNLGVPAGCTAANPSGCNGTGTTAGQTTRRAIAPNLRAPYLIQSNVGLDQQLFHGATISVNYQNIHGVHQFITQNATYAGNVVSTGPIVYQFQSEGLFRQNQIVTNLNYRGFRNASFFGYYVLNFAKSDTGGATSNPSQPGNLRADYGRANFDVRNRVFLGGSLTLPHTISFSPFLVAASGAPFNLTTGTDLNNDSFYNDRVLFASDPAADPSTVKTIRGCGSFGAPRTGQTGTPIPINYCTGPAWFTMNLRLTKTFGFGPSNGTRAQGGAQGGPGGPGGPGGRGGPGGGGGRGGGGFGGGGGTSTGKRYNLSVGAQAANIFNVVDRNVPTGTLTSPSFGLSTQLAGNIYTTDSAVRRVSLQMSFTF